MCRALWSYGILACVVSRIGYFELRERRGHFRFGASGPVGLICQTAWQPAKRSDPGNGAGFSLAENHSGPADPLWCRPGGWNAAADARSQRHRDDPDGAGVAGSQAGRRAGRYGSDVARSGVLLGGQGHGGGKSTGEWNTGGGGSSACAKPAITKESEAFKRVGPNGRHGSRDKDEGRDGHLLRKSSGNNGCRPAARSGADRSASGSNGRQSRGEGRESLCRLLHPHTLWEKNTKGYENEKFRLPTGRHVESRRHPGATSLPGMASLFQGVPSGFIHAALQRNSSTCGRGASERNSRHGNKETISCSASLPREIFRGLQRALSGVPGMLAPADASRGSNEGRKVRAHSKEFAKSPQRGQSPAGRGLQPSDTLGWGLPGCGVGPPILGRQCQETGGRLPRQDGEPVTTDTRASVRRGESVVGQRGGSPWRGSSKGAGLASQQQNEKEEKGEPGRRVRQGKEAGSKTQGGGPLHKQNASEEVGRSFPQHARGARAVLHLGKGCYARCLRGALCGKPCASMSNLFGRPPKSRVQKGTPKGEGKRKPEIGGSPHSAELSPRSAQCWRGRGAERTAGPPLQILGVVCRASRVFGGCQVGWWRTGGGDEPPGLMDHRVGHLGGRGLRGSTRMGEGSRSHPFGSAMQVLHKSTEVRQIWSHQSRAVPSTTRRLGRPSDGGGQQNRGESLNPIGRGSGCKEHCFVGEPGGLVHLGAANAGKTYEKDEKGWARPMPIRSRDQKTDWHPHGRIMDGRRLCQVRTGTATRAYARRVSREDLGSLLRSTKRGVEDFISSRIPHGAVLGMGTGTCPLLGNGRRTGGVAEESLQGGRKRTQCGPAGNSGKATGFKSREKRDGKRPGSGRTKKPLPRHPEQGCSMEAGRQCAPRALEGRQREPKGVARACIRERVLCGLPRRHSGSGSQCAVGTCGGEAGNHISDTGLSLGKVAGDEPRPRERCGTVVERRLPTGDREGARDQQCVPDNRVGYKGRGAVTPVPSAHRLERSRPSRKLQVLPGGGASGLGRIGACGRSWLRYTLQFVGRSPAVCRRRGLVDQAWMYPKAQAGRRYQDPVGGRLPAIGHQRADAYQATGRATKSERRRKRMGRHDARRLRCSGPFRRNRLPRCLLPVPTLASGAKTRSSQGQWVSLLHLRGSRIWFGLRTTFVVKASRSASAARSSGLLGHSPHTVLCGRPFAGGQRARRGGQVSESGNTAPAVAGVGLPTELEQNAAGHDCTVDRFSAAAERRLYRCTAVARKAGEAADGFGGAVTAQRSGFGPATQVNGRFIRLAHVNRQTGKALGRNDMGMCHRMRIQGAEACQGKKEFSVYETGAFGTQHLTQDDSVQLLERHLPLAATHFVANTDGCFSVWVRRHPVVWSATNRLVGRRNSRMGSCSAGGQNRGSGLAV